MSDDDRRRFLAALEVLARVPFDDAIAASVRAMAAGARAPEAIQEELLRLGVPLARRLQRAVTSPDRPRLRAAWVVVGYGGPCLRVELTRLGLAWLAAKGGGERRAARDALDAWCEENLGALARAVRGPFVEPAPARSA